MGGHPVGHQRSCMFFKGPTFGGHMHLDLFTGVGSGKAPICVWERPSAIFNHLQRQFSVCCPVQCLTYNRASVSICWDKGRIGSSISRACKKPRASLAFAVVYTVFSGLFGGAFIKCLLCG